MSRSRSLQFQKRREFLQLDCDICGLSTKVSRRKYVELIATGQRHRCRENGCERLCGKKVPVTARRSELMASIDLADGVVDWPCAKRGAKNGALAKLHVTRKTVESYGECR